VRGGCCSWAPAVAARPSLLWGGCGVEPPALSRIGVASQAAHVLLYTAVQPEQMAVRPGKQGVSRSRRPPGVVVDAPPVKRLGRGGHVKADGRAHPGAAPPAAAPGAARAGGQAPGRRQQAPCHCAARSAALAVLHGTTAAARSASRSGSGGSNGGGDSPASFPCVANLNLPVVKNSKITSVANQ